MSRANCLWCVLLLAAVGACSDDTAGGPPTSTLQQASSTAQAPRRIDLEPTGTLADAQNIQDAVDGVAPGGTVHLASGTFDLGEGSDRRTVVVHQGVRIEGAEAGRAPTIVIGGGAALPYGIEVTGLWANAAPSGPFRVSATSPGAAVSFARLDFRRWTGDAIYADAGDGLSVTDCTFTEPVAATFSSVPGEVGSGIIGLSLIEAVLAFGPKMGGRFVATNNHFDLVGDHPLPLADDETGIAILFTDFDEVRMENNTIRGHDDGVEIIRNKLDLSHDDPGLPAPSEGPSTLVVSGNAFDLLQIPPTIPPFIGESAIAVLGNVNVASGTIEHNELTLAGTPFAVAIALSGANLIVRENHGTLSTVDGSAILSVFAFGLGIPFAGGPFDLGASLDDSLVSDNVFTGQVSGPAVIFVDRTFELLGFPPVEGATPNLSHGDHVSFDPSTEALGALTLVVSPQAAGNTFSGFCGTILDLSPAGANRYLGAHCQPPSP